MSKPAKQKDPSQANLPGGAAQPVFDFNPSHRTPSPSATAGSIITKTEVSASHTTQSGPLPTPETLAKFDAVLPGLAERIVVMAETQFQQRVKRENDSLAADIFLAKRTSTYVVLGQIFSFVISMSAISGGVWVALHGQPWVAGAFGTGGLATLVIGILQTRKSNELQPAGKQPAQSQPPEKP